jgi:hypothetical protein
LPPVADADGTSLLPLLTGAADRLPRAGVPTEASSAPPYGPLDRIAVHGRTHTCIGTPAAPVQCWDQRRDPWQRADADADAGTTGGVGTLLSSLQGTIRTEPAPTVSRARREAGAPVPVATDEDAALAQDPDRLEQLRALGYIE